MGGTAAGWPAVGHKQEAAPGPISTSPDQNPQPTHLRAAVSNVGVLNAALITQHLLDEVGGGEHAIQGLADAVPAHRETTGEF